MAKKTVKQAKPTNVAAAKEVRLVKGVRLDLSPTDHQRLEHIARERGLTMASNARMVLLERLLTDEGSR
jgi:hypothetical protein